MTKGLSGGAGSSADSHQVQMTAEQLRFIGLWVAEHPSWAGLSITEAGRGQLEVVVWDKTNVDVARRIVLPRGNEL